MTLSEIMKKREIEVDEGIIRIDPDTCRLNKEDLIIICNGVLEIEKKYEDILDEKWAGIYAGTHKYTDIIEIPVEVYLEMDGAEVDSIDWEEVQVK